MYCLGGVAVFADVALEVKLTETLTGGGLEKDANLRVLVSGLRSRLRGVC